MGRFPRRPDLLLLQLSQGFSFPTEDALVYPLLDRVVRHILSWVLTPLCLSLVTPPAPKVGEGHDPLPHLVAVEGDGEPQCCTPSTDGSPISSTPPVASGGPAAGAAPSWCAGGRT